VGPSPGCKGRVGKLVYRVTGPCRIIKKLPGASYQLEHRLRAGRFDKKHAAALLSYPLKLLPFEPLDRSRPDVQPTFLPHHKISIL
jgi:hypothetical protein